MWLDLGGFGQLENASVGLKRSGEHLVLVWCLLKGAGGCQGLKSEKGET